MAVAQRAMRAAEVQQEAGSVRPMAVEATAEAVRVGAPQAVEATVVVAVEAAEPAVAASEEAEKATATMEEATVEATKVEAPTAVAAKVAAGMAEGRMAEVAAGMAAMAEEPKEAVGEAATAVATRAAMWACQEVKEAAAATEA